MNYRIVRTDKFNDQLYELLQYIANDSGSKETALNYLDELEKAISRLAEWPAIGSYPRYSVLRKQGYRVLIVKRHLIFYKVDDNNYEVVIHAIMDARRNYIAMI